MKLIRKFSAWLDVRRLETRLNDLNEMIRESNHEDYVLGLTILRDQVRKDLATARARFQSFDKPGKRRTWRTA